MRCVLQYHGGLCANSGSCSSLLLRARTGRRSLRLPVDKYWYKMHIFLLPPSPGQGPEQSPRSVASSSSITLGKTTMLCVGSGEECRGLR